jgi:major membrane immunogen (membrane-anchored lipoprotein)
MTKIIATVFAATFFLAACNESKTTDTTSVADTTNNTAVTTTTTTTTYTPAEGDVQYSGSKLMVMRNGAWVEADADVKYDNGVTVYRNGRVEKGDYEVTLNDGEVVNKSGDFFDKTGNAISNVWDATKEGASAAGRAVKKGVGKVGDKIEGVFDGDKKGENKDK